MKPIVINLDLPTNSYSIHIEDSWQYFWEPAEPYIGKKVMLVSDENVATLFSNDLYKSLKSMECDVSPVTIKPGEGSKSLETAQYLYTQALDANLDRTSSIIALGGGVVGDLAGFVAATYMRGINFIQVPTTLLAQIDSSVGGKVAVNHPLAKNIIGSFYQPKLVYINLDTLATLPDRQFSTGMAELIKYGFIWDAQFLEWLTNNIEPLMQRKKEALAYAIERCCRIKAEIVSQDERETGIRAILNFGHTIGHGLEALTNYNQYTHGEAVALGMVYESLIAYNLGLIDSSLIDSLIGLLKKANLPTKIGGIDSDALIKTMSHDKKNRGGSTVYILPIAIGKVDIFNNIDDKVIYKILG